MSTNNPQITIGVSAIDTSKQVLDQVDNRIAASADKVAASGDKIDSKWQKVKDNFKTNALSMAQTAAGLGAGIVGFATSFDTLEKAQLRARQTNASYQEAQEKLEKLLKSGTATADDIADAQEKVAIAQEKARLATNAANDTYTNFLANVPSQLLSFGTSAIGMFNMLGISQKTNAASAAVGAVTYNGALASMNAGTVATTGVMGALRAAFIATFISNPAGLIITAVATAALVLATNFDKVSSAFQYAGKVVYDFIYRYFRPLADLMQWFINGLNSLGAGLTSTAVPAIDTTSTAVDKLYDSTKALGDTAPAAVAKLSSSLTVLQQTGVNAFNEINSAYERFKKGFDSDTLSIFDPDFASKYKSKSGGSSGGKSSASEEYSKSGKTGKDTARYFDRITKGFSNGGTINEPTMLLGLRSGGLGIMAEKGPETITPVGRGSGDLNVIVNIQPYKDGSFDVETIVGEKRKRIMRSQRQGVFGVG